MSVVISVPTGSMGHVLESLPRCLKRCLSMYHEHLIQLNALSLFLGMSVMNAEAQKKMMKFTAFVASHMMTLSMFFLYSAQIHLNSVFP